MRRPLNKSTIIVHRRGNHCWSGIEWWCWYCSSLPHLLIISTIATAQYLEQFKDQKEI